MIKLLLLFSMLVDDRLKNFTIGVGNEIDSCHLFQPENFTTCVHVPGRLEQAETRLLLCGTYVQGRYVTIYMERPETMTLCEVEVYGIPINGK